MHRAMLGEFETPEQLLAAVRELRRRGYRRLDAFTPYPVHGADEALGLRRSPITWYIFPFGLAAAVLGYLAQWWCNAVDYPLSVGGRPMHSAPALVPIAFESLVLGSALAGVALFLLLSGLPELSNPIFAAPGFARATIDRFWVGVDARDPSFDRGKLERDLHELGAAQVVFAGGPFAGGPFAGGPKGAQGA